MTRDTNATVRGTIKALRWTEVRSKRGSQDCRIVCSIVGGYAIALMGDDEYRLANSREIGWSRHATLSAAKAAAQADYNARNLAAIQPEPDPGCRVVQYSDTTKCETCGLVWDTNDDDDPPSCPKWSE